jgi:multicomponent Na+:H+ antiporter subunit G
MTGLKLLAPWLADVLVVLGVFVMTVGVYGIVKMPDTYTRLHAASKMVFLGVISLLTASLATGDPVFIYRVTLIGVFLILTTPLSAHLIARAAFQTGEKMENPGGRRRVRTRAQQRRRVRTVRKALPEPGCPRAFCPTVEASGLLR